MQIRIILYRNCEKVLLFERKFGLSAPGSRKSKKLDLKPADIVTIQQAGAAIRPLYN